MPKTTYFAKNAAWTNGDVANDADYSTDYLSVGGQDTDTTAGAEEYHCFNASFLLDIPPRSRVKDASFTLEGYETQGTDGPKTLEISIMARDGVYNNTTSTPGFMAEFWPRTEIIGFLQTPATAISVAEGWAITPNPPDTGGLNPGLRPIRETGSVTYNLTNGTANTVNLRLNDFFGTYAASSITVHRHEVLGVNADGTLDLGPELGVTSPVLGADFQGPSTNTLFTFTTPQTYVANTLYYFRQTYDAVEDALFIQLGSSLRADESHSNGAGAAALGAGRPLDYLRLQVWDGQLYPRTGCQPWPIPGDTNTPIAANIFASAGAMTIQTLTAGTAYTIGTIIAGVTPIHTVSTAVRDAIQAWVDHPDYVQGREVGVSVYCSSDTSSEDDAWRFYGPNANPLLAPFLTICWEAWANAFVDPETSWDACRTDPATTWDAQLADPATDWNVVTVSPVTDGASSALCTPSNALCTPSNLLCSDTDWAASNSDPATTWDSHRDEPDVDC